MTVIRAEESVPQKLKMCIFAAVCKIRLHHCAAADCQRVGVETIFQLAAVRIVHGIRRLEQLFIQADFGGNRIMGRNPMYGALYLPLSQPAAPGGRIIGAVHNGYISVLVCFKGGTANIISVF